MSGSDRTSLESIFAGFRHRFTTHIELAALLASARRLIRDYGSLHECFLAGLEPSDEDVTSALATFVRRFDLERKYLLPSPADGSACKRLNLFLRWMVRCDAVDPGGWEGVSASQLLIPLDTHMVRIARAWGFTHRKSPGMRMVLDVTRAFRHICPEDPVRYDFVLTRFGIRGELDMRELLGGE